jgi:hypothetical protein
MAMQVLFMSTGFSMIEHFCKLKGKQTFILSSPPKCCFNKIKHENKSSNTLLKRKKCCNEQTTFFKITPNASQGHEVAQELQPHNWITITPRVLFFSARVSQAVSFQVPHSHNPAPPFYGRKLLVFIQSFLI